MRRMIRSKSNGIHSNNFMDDDLETDPLAPGSVRPSGVVISPSIHGHKRASSGIIGRFNSLSRGARLVLVALVLFALGIALVAVINRDGSAAIQKYGDGLPRAPNKNSGFDISKLSEKRKEAYKQKLFAGFRKYDIDVVAKHRFALVADLDRMSLDDSNPKTPRWTSVLKYGTLQYDNIIGKWGIIWAPEEEFILEGYLGEAGRGMELSELIWFNHRLLAFDDRSGIAFQIAKDPVKEKYACVPRYIMTEGDGIASAKGQKTEWATVKDGFLYVGSFGKEFVLQNGDILHRNNLWISVISPEGYISHEDWTSKYELMREATNTAFPGYMIHEAIMFNPEHRVWIVLPRRVSEDKYDEKIDEVKGSNKMLIIDENWEEVLKVVEVGDIVPERGYSSFKFLPGVNLHHSVMLAIKTVEKEDKVTGESEQDSYISMFDLSGKVLMADTRVPGRKKYEGLEFV